MPVTVRFILSHYPLGPEIMIDSSAVASSRGAIPSSCPRICTLTVTTLWQTIAIFQYIEKSIRRPCRNFLLCTKHCRDKRLPWAVKTSFGASSLEESTPSYRAVVAATVGLIHGTRNTVSIVDSG